MDFQKDKGGRFIVPLDAEENTLVTGAGERMLSRFLKAHTTTRPGTQAEKDLLSDTFWMNFQNNPAFYEKVSAGREVNKTLLEWMYESDSFDNSQTRNNTMRSLVTASLAWQKLITSDALEDARSKQEQAEQEQNEAQELAQEAAQAAADGDQEGAESLASLAQEAQDKANETAAQAVAAADKIKEGTFGKQIIKQVIDEANQEGQKVETMMAAWGMDGADVTLEDAAEVLDTLSEHTDDIEEMAKMIGRMKGIARESIDNALRETHSAITEAAQTQDVLRLFPSELISITDAMPEFVRAQKLHQLTAGGGLLGWRPIQEGEKDGAFIGLVDDSGSMYFGRSSTQPWVVAKAIALGLGNALKEEKRANRSHYEVYSFASANQPKPGFTSDDKPQDKLKWAHTKLSGGTDFNSAMTLAMERVDHLMKTGKHGIDVVMITDGIAMLSEDVIKRWEDFQSKCGARLFVINIGGGSLQSLEKIAEVVVSVSGARSLKDEAENIVRKFSSMIIKDRRR